MSKSKSEMSNLNNVKPIYSNSFDIGMGSWDLHVDAKHFIC